MIVTLENLSEATEQQTFDQVVKHASTMSKPSVSFTGSCNYRGEYGNKCFAGALMTDEEAVSVPEGFDWFELVAKGDVPSAHRNFIKELQEIHDGNHRLKSGFLEQNMYELKEFAGEKGLTFNGGDIV